MIKQIDDKQLGRVARRLAIVVEPIAGQVYFAPECHTAYERLGFGPSPGFDPHGVAQPDPAAYFCSRGSALGQPPGEVIAAALAVFKPDVVIACVREGWARTDAPSVRAARDGGAVAQLTRILGEEPPGIHRAIDLLKVAVEALPSAGSPMFAGLRASGLTGDGLGDLWRLADQLREFRADAHVAAWTTAGVDATEINVLTELYWGLPLFSYSPSRGWTQTELHDAAERLRSRGWLADVALSPAGLAARDAIESDTDARLRSAVESLGDELSELIGILRPLATSIQREQGYLPRGPHELAPRTPA
jgi:hypothetical protein